MFNMEKQGRRVVAQELAKRIQKISGQSEEIKGSGESFRIFLEYLDKMVLQAFRFREMKKIRPSIEWLPTQTVAEFEELVDILVEDLQRKEYYLSFSSQDLVLLRHMSQYYDRNYPRYSPEKCSKMHTAFDFMKCLEKVSWKEEDDSSSSSLDPDDSFDITEEDDDSEEDEEESHEEESINLSEELRDLDEGETLESEELSKDTLEEGEEEEEVAWGKRKATTQLQEKIVKKVRFED